MKNKTGDLKTVNADQLAVMRDCGPMKYKKVQWEIGTYCGKNSVCINMEYNGKAYHRHDYMGILPRWMRIGWYIRQIERESGCKKYSDKYVKQNLEAALSGYDKC